MLKAEHHTLARPFLRWAGGKRRLVEALLAFFPGDFSGARHHFFEPFVGGGALTIALSNPSCEFHVAGSHLHLNDVNPDLILAYTAVRDRPGELMSALDAIAVRRDQREYDQVRTWKPNDELQQAARFIYLNRTCFNGLWRVNSKGEFNVPFGRLKNPMIYDRANILELAIRLRGSQITSKDFADAVDSAGAGDLVYLDPPYVPLTKTASFAQYARDGFGMAQQERLAELIGALTARRVRVILSNSDTPEARSIFGRLLDLHEVTTSRSISARAESRGRVSEIVGTNF